METKAPEGYCQCGCGQKTAIAERNNTSKGWVKGQPLRFARGHQNGSVASRFWPNVDTGGPIPTFASHLGPCWLWMGSMNTYGYGRMMVGRKTIGAHRVSLGLVGREIPEGFNVDHLCRVHHCVNPDHLEVVTPGENVRRSPSAPPALNMRKTHCVHGHEFTPENTIARNGRYGPTRSCRECNRLRLQRRRRPELWPNVIPLREVASPSTKRARRQPGA